MKKIFLFVVVLFSLFFVINLNTTAAVYQTTKIYDELLTQDVPTNYYDDVDLSKSSDEIMNELETITSTDYVSYDYDHIYPLMRETDPILGDNTKAYGLYSGKAISRGIGELDYNREHVWAKSHGFADDSLEAYSDMHHLRPAYKYLNTFRNNCYFDEVSDEDNDLVDNPTLDKYTYGNKKEKDGFNVFEPRDEVKGDIARMLFYMAVRYKNSLGLKLVDKNYFDKNLQPLAPEMGKLSTLLKWNDADPVSPREIHRQEVVYSYQNNRNPFIDHPEYADVIWGSQTKYDAELVQSVVSQINALPENITIEDKETVLNLKNIYDALTTAEKDGVTNYELLASAVSKIETLTFSALDTFLGFDLKASLFGTYKKNNAPISQPEVREVVDLEHIKDEADAVNRLGATNYTNNTLTYDYSELLGLKLGTASVAGFVSFTPKRKNYNEIKVSVAPWQAYGHLDGSVSKSIVNVAATSIDGTKFEQSITMTDVGVKTIKLNIDKNINNITISTVKGGYRALIKNITFYSGQRENCQITHTKLRFGIKSIPKKFIDQISSNEIHFGYLYSTSNISAGDEYNDISSYLLGNTSVHNKEIIANMFGQKDSTYQAALVFSYEDEQNLELQSHYSDVIHVRTYMEYQGKLYFSEELAYSVQSLSQEYLNNHFSETNVKNAYGYLRQLED